MIVYHGSYMEVKNPDVTVSRANVDFGKGFYTTSLHEQAIKWAKRFKVKRGCSVVSIYEVDEEMLRKNFRVKEFSAYSEEWLEYIVACRSGKCPAQYDVVIGGVVNDKVFDTIEIYRFVFAHKRQLIKQLNSREVRFYDESKQNIIAEKVYKSNL